MARSYLILVIALLTPLVGLNALTLGPDAADLPLTGKDSLFKLVPERTLISADGLIKIQEYVQIIHGFSNWKITVGVQGKESTLDQLTEDDGLPNTYPAYFCISPDDKRLVRFQKMSSGESAIYLYQRTTDGFVPETTQPLSDLAWQYYQSVKSSDAPDPEYHMTVGLASANWEKNYLILSLSGFWGANDKHPHGYLDNWRCRYNLGTEKFDVPQSQAANNRKAINRPDRS